MSVTLSIENSLRKFLLVVLSATIWGTVQVASSYARSCEPARYLSNDRTTALVDYAWSGTRVRFDAVRARDKIFIVYFDRDRYFSVAEFDERTGQVCRERLQSRFDGWDSHKNLVAAVDENGVLHVAGNMHTSALVYARSAAPFTADGLIQSGMVGIDEQQTTYPHFVEGTASRFFFIYRSGRSGDGKWFVNRFDGTRWTRMSKEPLFTNLDGERTVNAYFQPLVRDGRGNFHVAVVWRARNGASENYAVTYATSPDLVNWFNSSGNRLSLPLSHRGMEIVDEAGRDAGLLNTAQVSVDSLGRPVIVYTKYGNDGRNVILAARPRSGQWTSTVLARSPVRTEIRGAGTLPEIPRFSSLRFEESPGFATMDVKFPGGSWRTYRFRASDLLLQSETKRAEVAVPSLAGLIDLGLLEDPTRMLVPIRDGEVGKPKAGRSDYVFYITQGGNRDRERPCSRQAPTACNPPPTPLVVLLHSD